MEAKVANFGSVFSYDGKNYIYLAYSAVNDIIYTAKILNDDDSAIMINYAKMREANCRPYNPKDEPYYCFVVLKSEDFVGKAASFWSNDKDKVRISTIHNDLNTEDKDALKAAILDSGVSRTLINLVRDSTT